ncbi:microtubule nucleation factor SSNA1-like [Phymastichus coffea]|uniref:microtubule nucleation factor SSNA1-like n=1 Tax=Phymastichus coffea TaxID=108790 RepID=UPI00273A8F55|nr:microtubule nucleation factor SSNA1-like [Phymastichus coffea]
MISRSGEAMQAFNQDLIRCLEDLKTTKSRLETQIDEEEAERVRLQRDVERMNVKISQLNESLGKKSAARADYEHTIQEAESAYMKILESSQLLLNMVKKEAACLDKTLSSSGTSCSSSFSDEASDTARCRRNTKESLEYSDDICQKSISVVDHFRKKKPGDLNAKT